MTDTPQRVIRIVCRPGDLIRYAGQLRTVQAVFAAPDERLRWHWRLRVEGVSELIPWSRDLRPDWPQKAAPVRVTVETARLYRRNKQGETHG